MATLLLLGATGCGPDRTPAPAPATQAPASVAASDTQGTVDALVRAARAGDRTGFLARVSARDPSFADRVRLLFDNLSGLPLDQLSLRLTTDRQPLSDARRAVLGPDAWRQQAEVRWRLTGEQSTAQQTVWLTFVLDQGRVRLAGTLDQPGGSVTPQPVWWTGPVTAARDEGITVVVGSGQPAARWLDRVRDAVAQVRRRVGAAAPGWNGSAVVEVPASRAAFEAVVGAAPGSYAGIAAVTLAEGPSTTAAVRVVVNPDVTATLAEVGVATVLTHELVHVATRSSDSPAPQWAVEGFADAVAFASHPGTDRGSLRLLVDHVRSDGPPARLPADASFAADRPGLDLSYAEAWSLWRYVAATWPASTAPRFYAALDGGASPDRAARQVLGVPGSRLTAGWRASLVRLAGG